MHTIICGSRAITDYALVVHCIYHARHLPTLVLTGLARGPDRLAIRWANAHGVPVQRYPADWAQNGHRAGLLRNEAMVRDAQAAIIIWDGSSRGTVHTTQLARKRALPVDLFIITGVRGTPRVEHLIYNG